MKKLVSYILLIVMAVSTVSCVPASTDDSYNIVTSFYPVMLLTKMVVQDIDEINVSCLASTDTGCLHDYALLPDDLKKLENADVFVINGLGMETFAGKLKDSVPDLKTIDLSKGIEPINDNAHIWLSPQNAQTMIATLCYELVAAMPQYSDKFNENTKKYTNMLIELNKEIVMESPLFADTGVITFHEAFDYFASEYSLRIDGTIQREPGEEPTVKDLVETTNLITEKGTKILLTEPQYPSAAAETLARETGARVYQLDPIVTGNVYDKPEEYFDKMRSNLNTLKEAIRKD